MLFNLLTATIVPSMTSSSVSRNVTLYTSGIVVKILNLFLTTHVKSLMEYSDDYARSIASGEYFYLDYDNKISDNNFGYVHRLAALKDGNESTYIVPLNKYLFFKGLDINMLICANFN